MGYSRLSRFLQNTSSPFLKGRAEKDWGGENGWGYWEVTA